MAGREVCTMSDGITIKKNISKTKLSRLCGDVYMTKLPVIKDHVIEGSLQVWRHTEKEGAPDLRPS